MPTPDANEGATLDTWLGAPMEAAVAKAIDRVRHMEDVAHVAVMPDVHLAQDSCVGTVMATRRLIYPGAVGGDIGCGMLAVAFDTDAEVVRDASRAGAILRSITEKIPATRRNRTRTIALPPELAADELSDWSLINAFKNDGSLQVGTLGGGNHFIELQADEDDRLWLMIHSGSRAMGQAIKAHHLAGATIGSGSMRALDASSDTGMAYLHDQEWARRFARANREGMAAEVAEIMRGLCRIEVDATKTISCDHNHVAVESHFGTQLLVHRKGAMPAEAGASGVIPGSMGTLSFHVAGKGCAAALRSSAHGAGRQFSRHAARERFARSDLRRQMEGVWFDTRSSDSMREESPRAYKDVKAVLRAQGELVKITRTLRPLLVYKAANGKAG